MSDGGNYSESENGSCSSNYNIVSRKYWDERSSTFDRSCDCACVKCR